MRALWKSDLPTPSHVLPGVELGESIRGFDDLSESRRMQLVDINYWMPGDILAKADRMTMAHSLELRVPYLDMSVASVSSGIPDAWKYRDGTTKWILREAFRDILPSTTAARAKLGFPTPLRHWLKQDPEWFRSRILDDSYIRAQMNVAPIERLFADHASGERDSSRKIYILLMLALWRRAFNVI
jgi:asparagine synthase (glutamine-hydrolysing)